MRTWPSSPSATDAEGRSAPSHKRLLVFVIAYQAEATLKQAMSLMTYSRRRHLMVTEGTRLVGILSLGDIVKNLLGELELEKAVLQDIYMAAH